MRDICDVKSWVVHLENELQKNAVERTTIRQENVSLQQKMETLQDKQDYLETRTCNVNIFRNELFYSVLLSPCMWSDENQFCFSYLFSSFCLCSKTKITDIFFPVQVRIDPFFICVLTWMNATWEWIWLVWNFVLSLQIKQNKQKANLMHRIHGMNLNTSFNMAFLLDLWAQPVYLTVACICDVTSQVCDDWKEPLPLENGVNI